MPSVLSARQSGMSTADEIEAEHVRHTLRLLTERSRLVAGRVADGRLAVVGAVYNLGDGRARIVDSVGLDNLQMEP
jgi:carbonic anhydrase